MSIDKKKVKKLIGIAIAAMGATFTGMSVLAKKKRASSVYENDSGEKNPFEGKKVVLVEDENDKENADGVRGHLEAVGDSDYCPTFYEKRIKRAIDIVLSFGGLVVLSPVFAVIALAIKIEDPGPVLFAQKRVGQNKRYFKLHKFRSMKMNTPHDVPTHQLENPDQYITKVGKFIRAHSLDELPQIWDIFVGNMSVIGPRPALWNQDLLTAERDKYDANDVKPGLTGWAQINGRDELEIGEKAKLDGEYVSKLGLGMDIKCFLGSVHVFAKDESVVEGGKKSLIMIPGLGDGLSTVKGKSFILAATYKMYARKYRVYIFSRKNCLPEEYSTRQMAKDQAEAMNALGIIKASVLGISQGGMIAQYLAIDYPNLIDKLILASTSPKASKTTQEVVGNWIDIAKQGNYKALMIDTAEKSYSERYLKKYKMFYPLLGKIGKPKSFDRFLTQANSCIQHNAYMELDKIICPTFIIGGGCDKIVGTDAAPMLAKKNGQNF